jgi:hypothetical protein
MEQPDCESGELGEKKLMLDLLWCAVHSESLSMHISIKRVTTNSFFSEKSLMNLTLRGYDFHSFVMIKGAFLCCQLCMITNGHSEWTLRTSSLRTDRGVIFCDNLYVDIINPAFTT